MILGVPKYNTSCFKWRARKVIAPLLSENLLLWVKWSVQSYRYVCSCENWHKRQYFAVHWNFSMQRGHILGLCRSETAVDYRIAQKVGCVREGSIRERTATYSSHYWGLDLSSALSTLSSGFCQCTYGLGQVKRPQSELERYSASVQSGNITNSLSR